MEPWSFAFTRMVGDAWCAIFGQVHAKLTSTRYSRMAESTPFSSLGYVTNERRQPRVCTPSALQAMPSASGGERASE